MFDIFPIVSVVYVSVGLTLMMIGPLVALVAVLLKQRTGGKKSPRMTGSEPSDHGQIDMHVSTNAYIISSCLWFDVCGLMFVVMFWQFPL